MLRRRSLGTLEPVPSREPSAGQRAQIARRYGMFVHFGINTFHDEEWTDGTKPPESYAPPQIDAEQWVQAAADAGMTFLVLVCKHHDGFCLWDSAQTRYSVASSRSNTNVVDAVAAACARKKIGFGIYYSLWDRHHNAETKDASKDAAYDRLMLAQLEELMDIALRHGPVVEWWFDGGWEKPNTRWPVAGIYETIKRRDAQSQIGINWSIGLPENIDKAAKPEQQREGFPIRYFPSDFRLGDPLLPADPDPKLFSHAGKLYYMPWETTVCMSQKWFFNTQDTKYKTLDELEALYARSTAQDNVLLLNCPPNREGRMRAADVKLLKDLAARLKGKLPARK
ncbi:MAG: alpha-L-fucosidase [Planctomycetes bacterium]|nr:alpha-L-fucosidase [Planctomycetota bacterium]